MEIFVTSIIVKKDIHGKAVVDKKAAFIKSIQGKVPTISWDYDTHLDYIQSLVRTEDSRVTSGALSNCRGTWFEWMIAIDLFNHWCSGNHNLLILPLPNVSQFDCATLYTDKVNGYIFDLRKKLQESLDIELITSNPDFVILDTTMHSDLIPRNKITDVDIHTIEFIDNLFRKFIRRCEFTDLVGYMATKTSLRPDRRLQIVHEGSLNKAIYVHLQTRLWINKPRTLKYFGASLKVSDKDRSALKTVATHSITTVLSEPERAVDECFELKSRAELYNAITLIHNIIPSL